MRGICKLCNFEKELLKRSHIVSEFFYEQSDMYDEHHQYLRVDIDKLMNGEYENRTPERPSKGVYEGGILCADCDNNILGGYETYGGGIIYSDKVNCQSGTTEDGLELSQCTGVDYTKFKLFVLAQLWRASISTRKEFHLVKLSPEVEEELRQMLHKGNPKLYDKFPFMISTYKHNNNLPTDAVIFIETKSKSTGAIGYRLIVDGFIFDYHLNPAPEGAIQNAFKEDEVLTVPFIPEALATLMIKNSLRV